MTLEAAVFYLLAALSVISAAMVVFLRGPLYSALSLIVTLVSLALLFVQLHAGFLAAIQVIVYAGAIMVLFVFIIMLLNLTESGGRGFSNIPSKALGVLLLGVVTVGIWTALTGASTRAVAPPVAEGFGGVESVGRLLFGAYVLPFELAGVLILVAILGTIVLARRRP